MPKTRSASKEAAAELELPMLQLSPLNDNGCGVESPDNNQQSSSSNSALRGRARATLVGHRDPQAKLALLAMQKLSVRNLELLELSSSAPAHVLWSLCCTLLGFESYDSPGIRRNSFVPFLLPDLLIRKWGETRRVI